jgi:class 3 adenylate cyclase
MFERHHAITREELRRHGGAEVDTAGDGFYVTIETPSRAIDCAIAIRDRVKQEVGMDIGRACTSANARSLPEESAG